MAKLLGTAADKKASTNQPKADDLLKFFNDKVASIWHATEGVLVESSLPPSLAVFDRIELYSADEIQKFQLLRPNLVHLIST